MSNTNIFDVYKLLIYINDIYKEKIINFIDEHIDKNDIKELNNLDFLIGDTIEKIKHMYSFYNITNPEEKIEILYWLKKYNLETIEYIQNNDKYVFK